jgi:endonuclease-3 related protein
MPVDGLRSACLKLTRHYQTDGWWPANSPFEVMVGAVLVQNTRWINVARALVQLTEADCLEPHQIACRPLHELTELIRPAGCQSIKARRLSGLAHWVVTQDGMAALEAWETARLRNALLSVHGIGPETADAILCFAFDRPVFVADQYARRWMQRMGWIESAHHRHYELARSLAERGLRDGADHKRFHAAIVLHGQAVCRRVPDCSNCTIQSGCKKRY